MLINSLYEQSVYYYLENQHLQSIVFMVSLFVLLGLRLVGLVWFIVRFSLGYDAAIIYTC